jgi:hypothetical protein
MKLDQFNCKQLSRINTNSLHDAIYEFQNKFNLSRVEKQNGIVLVNEHSQPVVIVTIYDGVVWVDQNQYAGSA